MSSPAGSSWAKNFSYAAHEFVEPADQRQLTEVMSTAPRLRLLGSRHSFNRIADTTGTMVSLRRMPVEVEIDAARRVVRTGGGITFGDLARRVHEHGWALPAMASLPHITVAGAIATDTHGSGDGVPSLAEGVVAVELVTTDGEVQRLQRGDEDFDGAVVSLGMLGALTHVELEIEPTYDVAQTVYDGLTWQRVASDLDAVTGLGTSVSVFTDWQDPSTPTQMWVKQRTDRTGGDPAALGLTEVHEPRHPFSAGSAQHCTQQGGIPGPWMDRLPHFRHDFTPSHGAEVQAEWLLPRAHAGAAIEVLQSLADRIAPLLYVCEMRTVAAGRQWLGLTQGVDCVAFHFTWLPDQDSVEALLPRIQSGLAPLGARPHWGKLFDEVGVSPRMAGLYPNLGKMRALRERLDPRAALRNDFLDRLGI